MKIATKVIFATGLMFSVVAPSLSYAAYLVDQTKTWAVETRAQDVVGKMTRHNEGADHNGNWGISPGNGDDEWGRSRGFWDTNAPGCPLKYCS